MSCLGKPFIRVLSARLDEWTEENGIYMAGQSGFRVGHSTTDNLVLIRCINDWLKKPKTKCYSIFIDSKKAFDLINREALWVKLFKIGVKGRILKILLSMYTGIGSRVRNCNGVVRQHSPVWTGQWCGTTHHSASEPANGRNILELE